MSICNIHLKLNRYCQSVCRNLLKDFPIRKGQFWFGENENNDTGSVLRISQLGKTEIEHMNQSKVPIHSIREERNLWFFNYKTGIRGEKNVESASRKMILNKSSDLVGKQPFLFSTSFE